MRKCETTEKWLQILKERQSIDTCPAGGVTSNTYIAVRAEDNKIVGIIDLRHHINHPILGLWGGHMKAFYVFLCNLTRSGGWCAVFIKKQFLVLLGYKEPGCNGITTDIGFRKMHAKPLCEV